MFCFLKSLQGFLISLQSAGKIWAGEKNSGVFSVGCNEFLQFYGNPPFSFFGTVCWERNSCETHLAINAIFNVKYVGTEDKELIERSWRTSWMYVKKQHLQFSSKVWNKNHLETFQFNWFDQLLNSISS